ncbi:bifunctional serine/threonine-protein kinase/formylglycine-generating enzyme family protein [Desulfoluna spongiiphila]|uniref:bifunctional serine/threonine-protein kinase/formylglycine-generating enzyme family protein n=1 Tax=Desulfoluna spongiiphila TaxID=419481 RepID=UPI001253F914|nr:bifunctional serine/threonine-protein kinase/formylglycine-generating enzyme family protein [Desulfoluna spongiiphila]VVS94129.1 c-type lectin fold [Desulfoluna spongiiphila]
MATCTKCGEELDAKARFCLACGTPVGEGPGNSGAPDPFKTVVKDCPAYGVVNLEQLPEGHLIDDRYEVKEKLGQGGFGAVYRVFDRKMKCEKALKVLPEAVASDREAMESIGNEAATMARLNHSNIVRIFEFQDEGPIKYIDMECVEGLSLTEVKLNTPEKKLREEDAVRFAKAIAEGLAYAHAQGVIHKDIKPQNILIAKDGTPKITDFGISETVKSSMSRIANSSSSGTLVYMSPEQINGRSVGREADIYSFGALLYELLSGHPPFYKGSIEYQILNNPPESLDGVSNALNFLVLRCLEKEYADRFRSFDEVKDALDGKDVPRAGQAKVPAKVDEPKRKKTVWLAVAVVIVLAVVAGVYGLVGPDNPQPGVQATAEPAFAETTVPVAHPSRPPKDLLAGMPSLKRMDRQIEETRETLTRLESSIGGMKERLDTGAVKKGDSLEAMLGLIQEKKEVSEALVQLELRKRDEVAHRKEEQRLRKYTLLKKDVEVYQGLIATEEGRDLKETAWRRLVGNHPEDAEGVGLYDTEALLNGGRLTVSTKPEGATVRILNIEPAYAPGMKLAPGRYEVEVAHEGYVEARKTVALARGEAKEVAMALKRMPTLTIKTIPADARVVIKGIPETYSPGMVLPPGAYDVVASARHHVSRKLVIRLAAGETKYEKVALVPSGRLTIDTSPAGASVVLIGIKEAYRPGLQLAPGEYRLLVKAKGYYSKEALVKVVAGKTTSVAMSLQNKKMTNSLGMEFVYIKPGTFLMGSPLGESGRSNDETQHRVTLSTGYYLQATEVTQGQWKAVMGSNPSRFKNCGDECPVEKVSWEDAQEFIRKLNAREGGNRYRLPTEAEWEYGCRGGSDAPYANGMRLLSPGWYDDNSGSKTHPVAQKDPNAWGLYDMPGNVYEWCQDWYGSYPTGHVTDPVGPSSGSNRVIRGGSWGDYARNCRSANRRSCSPSYRSHGLGFRVARTS